MKIAHCSMQCFRAIEYMLPVYNNSSNKKSIDYLTSYLCAIKVLNLLLDINIYDKIYIMRKLNMCTRENIMLTSLKLFLYEGFETISVNRIISAVGFSQAAFYYHFQSKDALIDEVMKKYIFDYMDLIIDELHNKECSWQEKIEDVFKTALNTEIYINELYNGEKIYNAGGFMNLVAQYSILRKCENVSQFKNNKCKYEVLYESIKLGQELGQINKSLDPKLAAIHLLCAQEGIKAVISNNMRDISNTSLYELTIININEAFKYLSNIN